jgi:hypothetical protein
MWICVLRISPKLFIFKSFKNHLNFFKHEKIVKQWLQWLINVFENSNFIRFISNYCTCFHNILRTLSSKHIKEMCNINIFLTWKHEKQNIGYSCYGSYICECTLNLIPLLENPLMNLFLIFRPYIISVVNLNPNLGDQILTRVFKPYNH